MKTFITKHRKGIKRMLIGCGIVAALGATVIFGMDAYVCITPKVMYMRQDRKTVCRKPTAYWY